MTALMVATFARWKEVMGEKMQNWWGRKEGRERAKKIETSDDMSLVGK
jgi:hypothetical protein